MFSSQNSQVSSAANYIEDVFSTWLYTGNGSTQTITNGIDLSTKGGMVITKARSIAYGNILVDTTRGVGNILQTSTTNAQIAESTAVTGVSTTGFSVGSYSNTNGNGQTFASWTFRKQPKFFDVVTYTGNGVNSPQRNISHSLGSAPGCVIIKATSTTSDWGVWHRGSGGSNDLTGLSLNTTAAATQNPWGESASFNSSTFAPYLVKDASNNGFNTNGVTYVAYLFAHDAGGFGLTGTDNVITCGSYTGNGSTTGPVVTLGYEPQWLLVKNASASANWALIDNMRAFPVAGSNQATLLADSSAAELNNTTYQIQPNATGFQPVSTNGLVNANTNLYIYIAIRRGPMKVPTSGTSVFSPNASAGTSSTRTITTNFPVDFQLANSRTGSAWPVRDRLRGGGVGTTKQLTTATTDPDTTLSASFGIYFDNNTGIGLYQNTTNASGTNYIYYNFQRAPSFFDVVCYTGTGANATLSHNLGVAPELIITKIRNGVDWWWTWCNYAPSSTNGQYGFGLNSTGSYSDQGAPALWGSTVSRTATTFSVGSNAGTNGSGSTYVAYLFATCAGVSKVGSYTGTGTTLQVNCGFTSGARFVLIKRTDLTGAWYVWDSARGIVAGNDPYLLLNSTAAEVTTTDYIDPYSAGFEISSTAPAAINASGGTFIFLAIA